MLSGAHLLDIAIVVAIIGGLFYWVFVAIPRENAQRREDLLARREAHQQAGDRNNGNR